MTTRQANTPAGFTIVELLIAISVFFLVLAGLFSILGPSNAMYSAGHRKLDVQQSARVAMDMIVRELRMAGYFPENFDATPGNDIAVADRNAVQVGTDTGLAIYGAATGCLDGNADGLCDADQTPLGPRSRVFLFCLNGTNLVAKVNALGVADSYTCTATNVEQQVLATNITALTFTYFDINNAVLPGPLDGQGLGVAPAFAVTAQRAAVRSVAITLTAQDAVPGQAPQVYTLRSNVRLRNL
jgi:type II secretory pathway pseudopilin PulG